MAYSLRSWCCPCRSSRYSGRLRRAKRTFKIKSFLHRAFEPFSRIVLAYFVIKAFIFFAMGLYEVLEAWTYDSWVELDGDRRRQDVLASWELCGGVDDQHRYAGTTWSWFLFTTHLLAALAVVSPALWLTSVTYNFHLRGTAIFALCNWVAHSTTFMQDAMICFGSLLTTGGNANRDIFDVASEYALFATLMFGWLILVLRLNALEEASLQQLTCVRLRKMKWILISVIGFMFWMVMEYFIKAIDMKDLFGPIWIPTALLSTLAVVTLRGLLVAARLARQAVHSAPPEQAERVRQTAADLQRQPLVVFLAMTTTTFSSLVRASRRGTAGPLYLGELRNLGPGVMVLERLVMLLDAASTAAAALILSGVLHGAVQGVAERAEAKRRRHRRWLRKTRSWLEGPEGTEEHLQLWEKWDEEVHRLAYRGVSVKALLRFWRELPSLMPHFDPQRSTTNDVVRGAIIPMSAPNSCAASEVLMDKPTRPDMMVTHNWANSFGHLIAAVVADALGEGSYENVARLLSRDVELLEKWVQDFKVDSRTYWICAFCVNQHLAICDNPRHRRDSVTGKEYPVCKCNCDKKYNDSKPTLPDGRSIECEMNKFDDMMMCLSAGNAAFGEVIAVDLAFDIFTRAWCIAEIATANGAGMEQHVVVFNEGSVTKHSEALRRLRIQDMEASRVEDKEQILASIEDLDAFNNFMRQLLLDDLFPKWASYDAEQQMEYVGRLIRWCRTFDWEKQGDHALPTDLNEAKASV